MTRPLAVDLFFTICSYVAYHDQHAKILKLVSYSDLSGPGMDKAAQQDEDVLLGYGIQFFVLLWETGSHEGDVLWRRTGLISPDFSDTKSSSVVFEVTNPPQTLVFHSRL